MSNSSIQKANLCKWVFILLLLLVLTVGEASAAVTNVSVGSFSGEKMNVYVRALVPGRRTPWRSIGHYDLMIEGVIRFRGKTFRNPVFSYRMEDSTLLVFNEVDTGKAYPHGSRSDYYYDCDIYQCRFSTGNYSDVQAFLKKLNNIISSSARYSGGIKCKFKSSSEFARYRASSTNCFYAVAMWLKGFGNDSLMEYYYGAHKGKYAIYTPQNLVKASKGRFKLKYAG